MRTPQGIPPFDRTNDGIRGARPHRGRPGDVGAHFGGPRHEGHRRGGPRARRGDVRLAVLALLATAPANGYSLIGQISDRTNGRWRPSPGSIYPVLRQLSTEELIVAEDEETESAGYTITDAGRAYLAENQTQADSVWDNGRGLTDGQEQLRESLHRLKGATRELAESGTEEQRERAGKLIDDVRRAIYGMLAE